MSNRTIFDYTVRSAQGEEVSLSKYRGKALLVVNTASRCGFTPQYDGLQKLYEEFQGKLEILAFPCDQFGHQEPGSDDEIQSFCSLNYGTKFPVFAKIEVNGEGTHPLYEFLKEQAPGILGSKAIKWNFTKFLIDRDGSTIRRFAPNTEPAKLRDDVAKVVAE